MTEDSRQKDDQGSRSTIDNTDDLLKPDTNRHRPAFYFDQYEHVKPRDPIPHSPVREKIYQFFAIVGAIVGGWYITWRWTSSLNVDALWFALPVALAETAAYIGMLLFSWGLWKTEDTPQQTPPERASDCSPDLPDRNVAVDVFFPTYDEDPELVRISLLDAKAITYPHPIDIRIHVLDDGKRESMKQVAEQEGVNYITRNSNIGFKAGNMRNGMEQTYGDFIVICDADTRPFSTILEHTLGYFKDPDVAWVQTPQWFFDLPQGQRLDDWLNSKLGKVGKLTGTAVQRLIGEVKVGQDPFVNDPQMFYDVIQRRRNWQGASFCCGAGSIHRREAVMETALKAYGGDIMDLVERFTNEVEDTEIAADLGDAIKTQVIEENEFTPYKFHVSEDIFTSIIIHSDADRHWKSVFHPPVESKMLSPQDLQTWTIQRFKYAGGALDIAFHESPLLKKGMNLHRKVFYAATFWSNFGALWNVVFLLAPIIYLFSGIAPVSAYSWEFYLHLLPFIFFTELTLMLGTWGVQGFKSKANYLAFFPVGLRAFWTVIRGQEIKFPTTPKERQDGNFFRVVIPQFTVLALTAIAIVYGFVRVFFLGDGNELKGVLTNTFWGINNIIVMSGMVLAAFWQPDQDASDSDTNIDDPTSALTNALDTEIENKDISTGAVA